MSDFRIAPRPADPEAVARFIGGADKIAGEPPWAGMNDKRRFGAFSMRLTDMELAMLKHIAKTTPDSMHEFCLKAVRKALKEALRVDL